jgi:hypothetical protein
MGEIMFIRMIGFVLAIMMLPFLGIAMAVYWVYFKIKKLFCKPIIQVVTCVHCGDKATEGSLKYPLCLNCWNKVGGKLEYEQILVKHLR